MEQNFFNFYELNNDYNDQDYKNQSYINEMSDYKHYYFENDRYRSKENNNNDGVTKLHDNFISPSYLQYNNDINVDIDRDVHNSEHLLKTLTQLEDEVGQTLLHQEKMLSHLEEIKKTKEQDKINIKDEPQINHKDLLKEVGYWKNMTEETQKRHSDQLEIVQKHIERETKEQSTLSSLLEEKDKELSYYKSRYQIMFEERDLEKQHHQRKINDLEQLLNNKENMIKRLELKISTSQPPYSFNSFNEYPKPSEFSNLHDHSLSQFNTFLSSFLQNLLDILQFRQNDHTFTSLPYYSSLSSSQQDKTRQIISLLHSFSSQYQTCTKQTESLTKQNQELLSEKESLWKEIQSWHHLFAPSSTTSNHSSSLSFYSLFFKSLSSHYQQIEEESNRKEKESQQSLFSLNHYHHQLLSSLQSLLSFSLGLSHRYEISLDMNSLLSHRLSYYHILMSQLNTIKRALHIPIISSTPLKKFKIAGLAILAFVHWIKLTHLPHYYLPLASLIPLPTQSSPSLSNLYDRFSLSASLSTSPQEINGPLVYSFFIQNHLIFPQNYSSLFTPSLPSSVTTLSSLVELKSSLLHLTRHLTQLSQDNQNLSKKFQNSQNQTQQYSKDIEKIQKDFHLLESIIEEKIIKVSLLLNQCQNENKGLNQTMKIKEAEYNQMLSLHTEIQSMVLNLQQQCQLTSGDLNQVQQISSQLTSHLSSPLQKISLTNPPNSIPPTSTITDHNIPLPTLSPIDPLLSSKSLKQDIETLSNQIQNVFSSISKH